jgi:hypothetical protein
MSQNLRKSTHYRWTHAHCPHRHDMQFGSVERGGPPPPRTHQEAVAEGLKCDEYTGPEAHHPRKTSGINGSTPFSLLPLFDIIRDLCPDMMHIVVNFFKHWISVLSGQRTPTRNPQFKKPPPRAPAREFKAYKDELARFKRAVHACNLLSLSSADQATVDTRMHDLSLCGKYVKKSHVPFKTRSSSKKPKAAEWYTRSLQ